jgi:hypothetical protein
MEVIFVLFFVGKHIFRVMATGDKARKKKEKKKKSTGVVTRQGGPRAPKKKNSCAAPSAIECVLLC